VPHFDFHFYTVGQDVRESIVPSDPRWAEKANHLPAPEFIPEFNAALAPPGVTPADIAVPMMGVHWVDVTSAELQGVLGNPDGYRPFTRTFIHGSWDGKVIFWEPMITRAHILSKKNAEEPEVRDEFTWRVTGDWASSHEERTVSPDEARRWLESGMSESYPTREPFRRVTDPAWEGATFLDSRELHRVLTAYEGQTDDLVPGAYCALAAMMDELERDFDVRVVLWFEPMRAPLPGDSALDERRRAIALASRTQRVTR
jgi:hypothetical protein